MRMRPLCRGKRARSTRPSCAPLECKQMNVEKQTWKQIAGGKKSASTRVLGLPCLSHLLQGLVPRK